MLFGFHSIQQSLGYPDYMGMGVLVGPDYPGVGTTEG
jgi:hypothetical protein